MVRLTSKHIRQTNNWNDNLRSEDDVIVCWCAGVCVCVFLSKRVCMCAGVLVKMQMSISICLRLVLQFPLKMDFHKGICHLTAIFLHRVKMQTHSFIYVEQI